MNDTRLSTFLGKYMYRECNWAKLGILEKYILLHCIFYGKKEESMVHSQGNSIIPRRPKYRKGWEERLRLGVLNYMTTCLHTRNRFRELHMCFFFLKNNLITDHNKENIWIVMECIQNNWGWIFLLKELQQKHLDNQYL